jgi:hypothetical protein
VGRAAASPSARAKVASTRLGVKVCIEVLPELKKQDAGPAVYIIQYQLMYRVKNFTISA